LIAAQFVNTRNYFGLAVAKQRAMRKLALLSLASLALTACPPEERDRPPNGERKKLAFYFDRYSDVAALAEGTTATIRAGYASGMLVFSSSDPAVLDVQASGAVAAVAPGTAKIIASSQGVEVDRIAIQVMRPDHVEFARGDSSGPPRPLALVAPGWVQSLTLVRSAGETVLWGDGGVTFSTDGVATQTGPNYSWLSGDGSLLFVTAAGVGEGRFIATAVGGAAGEFRLRGVADDEIDEVVELGRGPAGGNQNEVAIRLDLQAKSGGAVVGGVSCDWTVAGAHVGLDSVEPDGHLTTDLWGPRGNLFVATCHVGNIAPTFTITP
jgi:hypothetical protein